MRKNLQKGVCALAAALLLPLPMMAQYTGYTLVWEDNFNGGYTNTDQTTGLDMDAWNFETGNGDNGWGTGQRDYATRDKENIEVSDGTLKIRTQRNNANQNNEYTSGRINTKNKKSFLYGKVEARIRTTNMTESGRGFAFWMMPNGIPAGLTSLMWPQGGEIDIFEYNGLYPRYNLGSVHYAWDWKNNQWGGNGNHAQASNVYDYVNRALEYNSAGRDGCTGRNSMSTSKDNLLGADWHIYGINWYQDRIEFYVDQDVYHVFRLNLDSWCGDFTTTDNKVRVTTGWDYDESGYNEYWRPFENPFYVILSAGVGGANTYGGDIVNGNNPQQWTCTTEIDWVRCYELNTAKPSDIRLDLTCNGTQITATPTVTDGNAIDKVEYIVDKVPVVATVTTGDRSYTFTATKDAHDIYARAANAQGYWGEWTKVRYTKSDCGYSPDPSDECTNIFSSFGGQSNIQCPADYQGCGEVNGITYIDGTSYIIDCNTSYAHLWAVLTGNGKTIEQGKSYTISGKIKATKDASISLAIESKDNSDNKIFNGAIQKNLTANVETTFTATETAQSNLTNPALALALEPAPEGTRFVISDIVLKPTSCKTPTAIDTEEETIINLPVDCRIYPNPAKETVNIETSEDMVGVEVYGMSGKREISEACNGNMVTLTVSDLTEGIHFVKIITANGSSVSAKFLKR